MDIAVASRRKDIDMDFTAGHTGYLTIDCNDIRTYSGLYPGSQSGYGAFICPDCDTGRPAC